jgi:hypothetical protein
MAITLGRGSRVNLAWSVGVLAGAMAVALASAHNYAGGWNDGSRLATVECLVDYHTLAIDRSIFVEVPAGAGPLPYAPEEVGLLQAGTGDKLFIHGHYYSDKSPVPAVLMAGYYQVSQWLTGMSARQRPDRFCYWMTAGTSGLAYVLAVWCIYQLGGVCGLASAWRLALTASFGLSGVLPAYSRHVNNHILLLGVMAPLVLELLRLAQEAQSARSSWVRLLGLGTLAGLAYTVDLGAGPVLLFCTFGLVVYRVWTIRGVALFVLAALPWLVLHHAVNYAVGGTFKPANAVADYFLWPGCSFTPQNMTGGWHHANLGHFLTYAAALLAGKRGFLGHNLPLFLAVAGLAVLLWRRLRQEAELAKLPELVYAGCCCGGVWLAYALTSNNYSGLCCSIRWFVPLLAPGYLVLALLLREMRQLRWVFLTLAGWGVVLGGIMWYVGPWAKHMVPLFWPLQGAAVLSLLAVWRWRRRAQAETVLPAPPHLVCHEKAA